ncbi:S9 family peptidase [Acidiferrimicrobium sp. IK]|uniref:S9 family peptidase n=1 Tax=Acidiferrimicrobium sp. IK TaxID=2871700 RepID=UPI0021CB8B23|nr:S9 family peptidase [Acidiferrimicrobium sp. IK]MCU4187501.1 S9 family peptidase [Acidiferrimicrobium sp. IK]
MPAEPTPPAAPRRPHRLDAHGDVREDDWYWLADREDPAVIEYLEAENAYTDAVLAPTAALQERLFEEIKARVVETDVSSPSRLGGWWYWTRTDEGSQYRSYWRRADPDHLLDAAVVLAGATDALADAKATPGAGQLVLDENALAEGHDFFALGVWDLSPDHTLLAYAADTDGSERYRLRFRDLGTGRDLPDVVEDVSYGSAWARDSATFFYVRLDEAMRPFQVWRHTLGTDPAGDTLVHQEDDERFFLSVELTRSERFVVVHLESKMTSEARWIDAARPDADPVVVLPRRQGVEYDVEHAVVAGAGDVWLVRTNDNGATDFALGSLPVGSQDPAQLRILVPHRPGTKLDGVDAFAGHVVLSERAGGLEQLRVLPLTGAEHASGEVFGPDHLIEQPDPVYSLGGGANGEWDTSNFRYGYTSLVTPMSSIDYDVTTRARTVVKVQPVRGYRAEEYRTERIWATAPDGTRIPISLVAPKDQPLDGSAPCLLYGYGSYEITIDPAFSPTRVNLLERGFTFAIAHIRGGGEMGRSWYEQGRLEHKSNTFTDFIACAEHLVATGWTSPDRLVARGGSAGGLLMGAVTNLRPDLWRAVVAEVPFVDVVTTMSDTSLPLTVTEWEEWGNPLEDPAAYQAMKSYSPYDNVVAGAYPALYVTGGLNDPRVGYWEPAKWVAKLRAARTDGGLTLLRTEMGAGHQGASGRYDVWRDEARVQAFILTSVDITQ